MVKLKKVIFLCCALFLMLPHTVACSVDYNQINKFLLGTNLTSHYLGVLRDEAATVRALLSYGIISEVEAGTLLAQIEASVVQLNESMATSAAMIPVLTDLLSALYFFGEPFNSNVTIQSLEELEEGGAKTEALEVISTMMVPAGVDSSYMPQYNGYAVIASLNKADEGKPIAKKLSEPDKKQIKPWGDDKALEATIVQGLNRLSSVKVYVLDTQTVLNRNSAGYATIVTSLLTAVNTGNIDASISGEPGSYFTHAGTLHLKDKNFTIDDIMEPNSRGSVSGYEMTVDTSGRVECTYLVRKLKSSADIIGLLGDDFDRILEKGVLVKTDNDMRLYVTQYDIGVLRGFYNDTVLSTGGSTGYVPIIEFLPDAVGNTPYRTQYSGSGSSFSIEYKAEGSTVKLSQFPAMVFDLYRGVLLLKDDDTHTSIRHDFISLGHEGVLSSVVAVPNLYRLDGSSPYVTSFNNGSGAKENFKVVWAGFPNVDDDGADLEYFTPNFVLADYLELVYMPTVVGDEPLVATGRKLRLDNSRLFGLETTPTVPIKATDAVAYITGAGLSSTGDGFDTSWSNGLIGVTLAELLAVDSFFEQDGKLKSQASDEYNRDNLFERFANIHIRTGEAAGAYAEGDPSSNRGGLLPKIAAGQSIECVMQFGTSIPMLNVADAADDNPQRVPLFGIPLNGDAYGLRGLSGWLIAPGNKFLDDWAKTAEQLGYPNYKLDPAIISAYLKNTYALELAQDGLWATLNMDTAASINEEASESNQGMSLMILRTILIVFGFALLGYASILLAAWAMDVNMDLGLNLLHKLSFKYLMAVRSKEEMPEQDPEGKTTYITWQGICVRSVVFTVVGIILITVDPIGLVVRLMDALNTLLSELSHMIFGTDIM